MSFILDALKKSESERNRQSGPTLMEMRVAPPRSRLPLWGVVIGGVLLLNLGLLLWLLLRPTPVQPAMAIATPAPLPAPAQAVAAVATAPAAPVAMPALPTPEPSPPANTADFEPALPARSPLPSTTNVGADLGLPTIHDLNASGANLPELRLSLHVYDAEPSRRYVLLNSTRLREGESTPDGLRLERITESGVVLAWRNRRFTVQRGE